MKCLIWADDDTNGNHAVVHHSDPERAVKALLGIMGDKRKIIGVCREWANKYKVILEGGYVLIVRVDKD